MSDFGEKPALQNHEASCPHPTAISSDEDGQRSGRQALRKLDLIVVPLLTSIYLLAFLDRTNLGNARVAGLQEDLHLNDLKYRTALCVTYVPYILTELPSNLIIKRVGPKKYLPALCLSWGIVATLQSAVQNYAGLLACRFFLGGIEGGLFPGLVLYLSIFYTRTELVTRLAVFFTAASLSGAFGGLLVAAIGKIDVGGLGGWRWIFLLEGIFTILWAIFIYFALPNDPRSVKFLTPAQNEARVATLCDDVDMLDSTVVSARQVLSVFKDIPVVCVWLTSLCTGCSLYGLGYFSPTIVQEMHFSRTRTQLMTAPPYAAAVPAALLAAWLSIKYKTRGIPMIVTYGVALVGAVMFRLGTSFAVRYAAVFLLLVGTYANVPCQVSWNSNNTAGHARRATAIAITTVAVNIGGIISTWIFPIRDAPYFRFAAAFLVGTNVFAILATALAMWIWNRRNHEKQSESYREKVLRDIADLPFAQQLENVGDKHPDFVYVL